MPNKFEEKLSHLSVSEREDLEKLMKKYPGLFSDAPRKCSSRMVFHSVEGKKKRKLMEEEFSSSKFDLRKTINSSKIWRKEEKENEEKGILFPNVEI